MLRLAMPPHAIGVNSTIRTSKGVHRMRFDRWGDHSHQFQPYNLKVPASGRSQNEINRYETERRRASSTPPHPSRRSNPGQEEYRNYNTSKRRNRMRSAPGMRSPYRPDTDDLSSSQDETWKTPYEYRNKGKGKKTRTSKKTESYYPPSPQYISHRHQTTDEEEEDRYSRRSSTSTQARPPTPERGYFPLRRSSTLDTLPQMPPAGYDVPDTELPVRQIGEAGQASPATPSDPPSPAGPPPAPREGALSFLQAELNRAREVRNLEEGRVQYMDQFDTHHANGGYHRVKKPNLKNAEQSHVVFEEAPASPSQADEDEGYEEEEPPALEPIAEEPGLEDLLGEEPVRDPQAPPVPLEPLVIVNQGGAAKDPDCLITGESPAKAKNSWALKKQAAARAKLVLVLQKPELPPTPQASPDSTAERAQEGEGSQGKETAAKGPGPKPGPSSGPDSGTPNLY